MSVPGQGGADPFDLDRAWALSASVVLRPERFGALAYDFRTRRLSMLKDPGLVKVVQSLSGHVSAREACVAARVADGRLASFVQALDALRHSGIIQERSSS